MDSQPQAPAAGASPDDAPAAAPAGPAPPEPAATADLQTLASVPLLKFEGPGEVPVFQEEGLQAIQRLPGPVCPVAFVGDGRSGKSFLASKIVGEGAFHTDDSDVAVTEGIDVAVVASHPGHMLVLDCEGGNNALSKSHSIVTVVGALACTALIFVTDGKASEAAVEALAHMLVERSCIKCDGTGTMEAQTLLFVVNQNRLRYSDDGLEKILAAGFDDDRKELRTLISDAYQPNRRRFFTVPSDQKSDFHTRLDELHDAVREAATPLKMGRLWMTGPQTVHILKQIGKELTKHGKVSLPSLHRRVILDGWLRPTVDQILGSRMDKLLESFSEEELATHKVGRVKGKCGECGATDRDGWLDPDVDEFFCEDCWTKFSPKVLKCSFCLNFQPWMRGRVEQVTKMWHCMDCLMQLGIEIE